MKTTVISNSVNTIKPTILVCDSCTSTLENIRQILTMSGFQIIVTNSGEQALELFEKHLPDLAIIADNTSGLNGYKVCEYIHSSRFAEHTPVMMLTTTNNMTKIGHAFEHDWINDYMAKPLNMSIFNHRIKYLLKCSQAMVSNAKQINHPDKYDPLTGLCNRQNFTQKLEKSLIKAKKNHTTLGVLLIDIDNFKRINDTLGHQAGDQLLQEIGERLAMSLRTYDVVMREKNYCPKLPSEFSRLGGDEFTIFVENIESVETAINIAKRNIETMERPFIISGQEMVMTPSIGIATYPYDGKDINNLLKSAERAMYEAKAQGGCCCKLSKDNINSSMFSRLKLENELRISINEDALQLYYQPQVVCETGEVVRLEALCRWQHAELGMVSPNVFIPLAEESELIVTLGDWVLHKACSQAKQWLEQGKSLKRIAVNVSANQFSRSDFFDKVVKTLNNSQLPPQYLELELTESILLPDDGKNIEKLKCLKRLGVRLAIDDFGTGYSSLSYLQHLPIDTLKIDRSFIVNLSNGHKDCAIVGAIIALAEKLSLEVVAEGVENIKQIEFFKNNGCALLQGFYFSQARPAHEITKMLGVLLTPHHEDKSEHVFTPVNITQSHELLTLL